MKHDRAPPPIPQPEFLTRENALSTFSMNVSDVSFKLAQASLQKSQMPDAASIRSEEFINAFDYRDPEAAAGQPPHPDEGRRGPPIFNWIPSEELHMNRILIAAALAVSASLASAQAVNVTLSEWKVGIDRDTVQAG